MMHHMICRDFDGVFKTQDDIAEAVSDKDDLYGGLFDEPRESRIIAGNHGDFFALGFLLQDAAHGKRGLIFF